MNETIKIFYSIISKKIKNDIFDCAEIQSIENAAYYNGCLPIFYESATQAKIAVSPNAKDAVWRMVAYNYKNMNIQNRIINMLHNNDIKCAVIKGTSCSVNYDNPDLRLLGDIDILVSEEDYEKSIDIFVSDKNKISEMHKFHYQFMCDGISVEIHRAVTDFEENEQQIEKYMKSALNNLDVAEIETLEFPVMKSEYQAVMLLLHTKRHYFENALTTKMLYDWGMFVSKIDVGYWNEIIVPILENYSLRKWADALSAICSIFLNISCADKIQNKLKSEFIEILAEKFVTDRYPVIKQQSNDKNSIFKTIHFINKIAYRDYKITKKCKLLLPVFWIVIGIRYIYRCKIGMRGKVDIMTYSKELYDKEMIFEVIGK